MQVPRGLLFLKLLILDNHVKKFAAIGVLHDEVEILFCLYDLVDLDDVGMVELFEDFDLATDSLDILLVFDL